MTLSLYGTLGGVALGLFAAFHVSRRWLPARQITDRQITDRHESFPEGFDG